MEGPHDDRLLREGSRCHARRRRRYARYDDMQAGDDVCDYLASKTPRALRTISAKARPCRKAARAVICQLIKVMPCIVGGDTAMHFARISSPMSARRSRDFTAVPFAAYSMP